MRVRPSDDTRQASLIEYASGCRLLFLLFKGLTPFSCGRGYTALIY